MPQSRCFAGDTAPLRAALRQVPANFDPGGSTSTIALRVSLMERDLEEADRVLAACALEKLDDNGLSGVAGALDGYTVPKRWYAGLIARARGDESSARKSFEQAKKIVENDRAQFPDDAKIIAMLALIYAELGEKSEAQRAAARAGELLPIAKDSFDGPILMTTLAAVSAKLGEKDFAIQQLESVVGIPNGPQGTLRAEPVGYFARRSAFQEAGGERINPTEVFIDWKRQLPRRRQLCAAISARGSA